MRNANVAQSVGALGSLKRNWKKIQIQVGQVSDCLGYSGMKSDTGDENLNDRASFSTIKEGSIVSFKNSFYIACLDSEPLRKLFHGTTSYVQNVKIEVVHNRKGCQSREEHPASTIGLVLQRPVIQIADWLGKQQRIEAIAHELAHLLLVYRSGLGVVGRRVPRPGDSEDIFRFFMSMKGDWIYLLGQVANTVHHLILIDLLRQEYGIEDSLHASLLHQNFCVAANDTPSDKESQYGMGLVAFEYERLIGKIDRAINVQHQSELFWEAYHLAQKHFGKYCFQSTPTPACYQGEILSFLEDLGYPKEDFVFFP